MAFLGGGNLCCPRIADHFPARSSRSNPPCILGLFHPGPALRQLGPTQWDGNGCRRPGSLQPLLRYDLRPRRGLVRLERDTHSAALARRWPDFQHSRSVYRMHYRQFLLRLQYSRHCRRNEWRRVHLGRSHGLAFGRPGPFVAERIGLHQFPTFRNGRKPLRLYFDGYCDRSRLRWNGQLLRNGTCRKLA